jgi:hypothetical protein
MNCQEFARILDERDISSLGDADRQRAHSHLTACADCRGDWEAQEKLAAPVPALPVDLAQRCRELVASTARRRAPHAHSRLILLGTMLTVAAASALLGGRLWNSEVP